MSLPTLTKEPGQRPVPPPRLRALGRWGAAMARHRRIVLGVWLLLAVLGGAAYPLLHDRLGAPDYTVPGSASSEVDSLAAQHFPQFGAEQDLLVFHSARFTADAPEFRAAIDRALVAARETAGVTGALGPFQGNAAAQISPDRHTAFGIVGLAGDMSERVAVATRLQSAVTAISDADIRVAVTGYGPAQADLMDIETADMQRAETIGLPVAAAVLVLALGALAAATLPITVTAAGIAAAVGALFGLTTFLTFDSLVLSVATMIATGTAIDYAMFIVSRFNEELTRRGVRDRSARADIDRAVAVALDTTGRTVLASGLIVLISLCSLAVVGLPMLDGVAIGVVTAVLATLSAAVTLLPALLATLGPAVNRGALPARLRPAETRSTAASSAWARWAHTVMRRPVVFGLLGVAALAVAAAPITGIRYGIDMGLDSLGDRPSGQATQLVRDNFGPGLLAPLSVLATGPDDGPLLSAAQSRVHEFADELSNDPRVATVFPQQSAGRIMITVVPRESFDSTSVAELTDDIRSRAGEFEGAELRVGGTPATFAEVSERITARFPWVIALVLTVSLAFLILAFRSIVLAVKAILLNLLATGAALGITVGVFQYGVGESVLGFQSTGFLQVYLPMLVFAVLFGLSMDYEVFLIRRMKEAWDRGNDNAAAVAEGLQRTARPITAAAAIMVAVFASFVTAEVLELKQIGLALAVAITIDALVVRLILVPAFMRLFGRWNWWLPRWPAKAENATVSGRSAPARR
ncbi:MMPL family transporter [Nocardia amikacinitolerans]|uniref:MMPL family transporter n=1 Tax=Nocardia amikacinitolerans TaxID=756689 RepID=UPI0020A2EB37|nr:MMPL family transporter [Nocardia amikacinitolerans]MCP2292422.1 putative drug exporter of the RND superfamily [Nocardia amikacinitolerans]